LAVHRESLCVHSSNPAGALRELHVDIEWRQQLMLHYELRGSLAALRIPSPSPPLRTDELWRHTCCELFLALRGSPGYFELNFSPGGPWAAYRFDGYRSGMQSLPIATPRIATRSTPDRLDVDVELSLDAVPLLAAAPELRCGLTAIIEELSGVRSFWALAHPAAQPDFHHADGFVLSLARSC
jgi:hypothetical protein